MVVKGKGWFYKLNKLCYHLYFNNRYNIVVEGRENISKDHTYIIASRHFSTYDPPILTKSLEFIVNSLAKDDFFVHPIKNWVMRSLYVHPIGDSNVSKDSVNNLYELCTKLLKEKKHIMLYPEGKLTPDGRLQPFKAAIARIASKAQENISKEIMMLPMSIIYSPHHMIKGSDVFVTIGKPFSIKEFLAKNHFKALQSHMYNEIGKLTKVCYYELASHSLVKKPEQYIDELVENVYNLAREHLEAENNIDSRLLDISYIEKKTEELKNSKYLPIEFKENKIMADIDFINGYYNILDRIISSEKKSFGEREITIYDYPEGMCALLCKRGYPMLETNIHITREEKKYVFSIEKLKNNKLKEITRKYFDDEKSAVNEMESYINDNELLEDQVNIFRYMANKISHLSF